MKSVCIIGMGYVGLTLAVAFAEAGISVRGVERDPAIRATVAQGRAHFFEAGLDEPLARHVADGRLDCVASLPPAGSVDAYIITVGTPLTIDGAVNLAALEQVLKDVATRLKPDDLVVLRSTVKTGVTRGVAKRILDGVGIPYHLAFCPERTLEGKAVDELRSLPQIVGGLTQVAVERAAALFSRVSPKIIPVSTLEAAEMVKLINNTERDLKFAFANEIAEMCDATGVLAVEVIRAANQDYPRSSLAMPGPVGGPCLEKDPHILAEGLREVDYTPRVALTGRRLNEELPRQSISRMARKLEEMGVPDLGGGKITILGLAFKGRPETSDLRGTMAAHILQAARARWPLARYHAFDPVVPHDQFDRFDVAVCPTLKDAFDGAVLVLIQNNHPVFSEMDIKTLSTHMASPSLIYDYWNLFALERIVLPPGRRYGGLGSMAIA